MKKTVPLKGQAYLNDGGISYAPKGTFDIDIDELDQMIKDTKEHTQRFMQAYYERMAEKEKDKYEFIATDAYNARLFNYPTGQHVTLYSNAVQTGYKNKKLTKSYQNEYRTTDEENHCIKVSLGKTKNTIYNIARSNVWKWFITLTLNSQKVDRSDYERVVKKLTTFLNNLQKRHCPNLKYLIVPELHKDRTNYHFHGLLAECDELEFVFSGKFDNTDKPIFNIPQWSYGFTTATLVESTERASSYITKYVTKESEQYLKNKHRYYTNRNTLRTLPEKLVVGDTVDFIKTYADDITYMKDITIKPAYRKCTYLEMPYNNIPVKENEKQNE